MPASTLGAIMSLFEKLREQIDLAELAASYTDLQPSGRALVGCCPHPDHDDEHPSFFLYPEDGRFFCFGCRWHGDVTDLWAAVKRLKPGLHAGLDLAREYGVNLPKTSAKAKEEAERRRNLEAAYLRQAEEHHEALSQHPHAAVWWEGRGFDEGLREKFLLGVTDDGAAATIPYWSRGRVHGLIRRKFTGDPKYVLPRREEFPSGHRPLFLPGTVNDDPFLAEGYVDALALSALGYSVAAIGGTHPNQEQVEELKRLPGLIYVLPDADEEGEKAARRLVEELYPKAMLCPPEYERKETNDE